MVEARKSGRRRDLRKRRDDTSCGAPFNIYDLTLPALALGRLVIPEIGCTFLRIFAEFASDMMKKQIKSSSH